MYNIIDGKKISKILLDEYSKLISNYIANGKYCTLADIIVGNDQASKVYIENKKKRFEDIGIKFKLFALQENITETELVNFIHKLNIDKSINAIFIEFPLPKHINETNILKSIAPKKDVDGFSLENLGSLFVGNDSFSPCTAEGIIELLKRSNIKIDGKHCVVIGRSNIVGKPVAMLLLNENATITICHSKTNDLIDICKKADILIVAIGKPKFINSNYIKNGAVVIDAGINTIITDGKKSICGDVDFDDVAKHTSFITPVPGGVGPMTITMLIKHCIDTINNE